MEDDLNNQINDQLQDQIRRMMNLLEEYPDNTRELILSVRRTLSKFERRRMAEKLLDESISNFIDSDQDVNIMAKTRIKNTILNITGLEGKMSDIVEMIINEGIRLKNTNLFQLLIIIFNFKEIRFVYMLEDMLERANIASFINKQLLENIEQ